MPRIFAIIAGVSAAVLLSIAALISPVGALTQLGGYSPPPRSAPIGTPELPFSGQSSAVCTHAGFGQAACSAQVLLPANQPSLATPAVVSSPSGLSPSAIDAVYGFSGSGGSATIGIVDAYDDPSAASDLAAFSQHYGLPTPNFTKVNQSGGSSMPPVDSGWALEISLDIEWAHAIAPSAPILLVEASSSGLNDLITAEKYAGQHASFVSNSWGAGEFGGETIDDSAFSTPGVSYFASSGDSGRGTDYPAVSPNVTAVGGTSLKFTSGNLLASETAWSGSGGGCSILEHATTAQLTFSQYSQVHCNGQRAVPDVSLDADPKSGVAVLDSTPYSGSSGWWTVGGTSVASPIWAAEASTHGAQVSSSTIYGSSIPFRDILTGSNGYSAGPGLDLVTGRGSWANTPGTPTGLTATASSNTISLSWTAPTAGSASVSGYTIWRGTSSGGETQLATGVSGTSFGDSTVTSGVKYFYEVEPTNSSGPGPFSNEASATAGSSGSGGSGGTGGTGGSPPPPPPPPPPPSGSLKASIQESCPFGPTCTFTSTSTDSGATINSYSWTGTGGVSGTNSSVSHTYSASGSYTVQLTVKDTLANSATASTSLRCVAAFNMAFCFPTG